MLRRPKSASHLVFDPALGTTVAADSPSGHPQPDSPPADSMQRPSSSSASLVRALGPAKPVRSCSALITVACRSHSLSLGGAACEPASLLSLRVRRRTILARLRTRSHHPLAVSTGPSIASAANSYWQRMELVLFSCGRAKALPATTASRSSRATALLTRLQVLRSRSSFPDCQTRPSTGSCLSRMDSIASVCATPWAEL
jgi:hypothetical protein